MDMIEPATCRVDVPGGELLGASGRYRKSFGQLAGLYADTSAFESLLKRFGDEPVYEVTDLRPSSAAGDVITGVTRMVPGKVGDEYFITRGHIHAVPDRSEIYYGEAGNGVMLLESPTGETRALPLRPREIVYVPPYWIHRTANVGTTELVFLFVYPADAGQDYGIIERSGGMQSRIVDDGSGGWGLRANANYIPRTEAAVDALYNACR
jgi:glucose-6-phosphate isomerase